MRVEWKETVVMRIALPAIIERLVMSSVASQLPTRRENGRDFYLAARRSCEVS